ncbi:MAG TPA: R3H domain-containing nucleic acid-binding protein [Thermoanaerobaculia bacterium]|nr:R3H domain-containing nucleic acid-binding protein [Thermoanaerobaculia bacterium]
MDDLELLLGVMPPHLRQAIEAGPDGEALLEIVLDLGRAPEARFAERGVELTAAPVTRQDIAYVVDRVGDFGKDNRAGIERTLHRISALRNRRGDVVGLTCRIGRAVYGTVDILRDVIEAGRSILLLGRPGVGKTTLLREAARVLADDLGRRVVVVDTSNEIAGDGDVPHPGIGRARRMQVPAPELQHAVMIEAVENHMPQVIVIDEIGTTAEAMAARTIAERGVQLIATAHGNTLENLLQNPTLSDLVGGIQAVTLSDEEARRRGTQKTVLERKAPPTFAVLIEIQDKERLAVHHDVAEVVDRLLREAPARPELRLRTAAGGVEIQRSDTLAPAVGRRRPSRRLTAPPAPAGRQPGDAGEPAGDRGAAAATRRPGGMAPAPPGVFQRRHPRKLVRIHPYAVSKAKLERAIRKFRAPALIVEDLDGADLVLTLKAQERRQPRRLREAQARGIPVAIVKSNTIVQIENTLRAALDLGQPADIGAADEAAVEEAEAAIDEVLDLGEPVELAPRNPYLRRLQHQTVERHGLASESKGEGHYRRVVILPG